MNKLSEEPLDLSLHPAGINTVQKETSLGEKVLRDSVNFDISSDGKKKVRPGYTKLYDGTNIHSLSPESITLGTYFVSNGIIKKLNSDNSTIDITAISSNKNRKMQYIQLEDKVYFSNGYDKGIIENDLVYSWGVPNPIAPEIEILPGSEAPGEYYFKFVNIKNGEFSGASEATLVTATSPCSFRIQNIPYDTNVDTIRVYATPVNGNKYYQQVDLASGTTDYKLSWVTQGVELDTDNLYPVPPGHILTRYNGRLYIANNNFLYWTEPLRFGLMHYQNYIEFPERITILIDVEDGIYVASDKTYFLEGSDPKDFKKSTSYPYRGLEGTQYKLFYNVFNIDDYFGETACWTSEKGIVYGQRNGTVKPVTEKRYALDEYTNGASTFFEQDGIRKFITTLQNKGGSSSFRARDKVTATIIRANEVTQ